MKALLVLGSTLLFAVAALAVPPNDIPYQGLLRDTGGVPLAGPVDLDLGIWDAASGGTLLYGESHTGVALDDGVFHVLIGAGTPGTGSFDALLFSEPGRWLEVTVDGETLAPRQAISSAPYALSDTLGKVQTFRYEVIDNSNGTAGVWTGLAYTSFMATKELDDTRLEVTWTDSYRTISTLGDGACGWTLFLNGSACSPSPLLHVQYSASTSALNPIQPATVTQVCEGIPAGNVSVQAFLQPRDGDENCFRGSALGLSPGSDPDLFPAVILVEEVE